MYNSFQPATGLTCVRFTAMAHLHLLLLDHTWVFALFQAPIPYRHCLYYATQVGSRLIAGAGVYPCSQSSLHPSLSGMALTRSGLDFSLSPLKGGRRDL